MNAPLYQQDVSSEPRTSRGLMANIWRGLLAAYCSNDPAFGVRVKDDFEKYVAATETVSSGGWQVNEAAVTGGAATLTSVAGVDGVAELSSDGTLNHQGAEATGVKCINLPTHTSDPRGPVAMQFRVDPGDADTIFVGLSEGGAFLSATSQLPTASDYMGFYSEDGGATWDFKCANDNNGGTAVTGSFDIPVAAVDETGYNNFGARVNKDGSLEIGVNDYWYPESVHGIASTALPIETLCVQLSATAGGGTTAPTIQVDSVDAFMSA